MRPAPFFSAAVALLALAGCGRSDDSTELNEAELARAIENIAEERPAGKETPPEPALLPLEGPELGRELKPGAGCGFSADGRLLFAAVAGDAVGKVSGRIVHFATGAAPTPTGGFFTGGPYSISIGRISEGGLAPAAETQGGRARLVLTDRSGEQRRDIRLEGTWRCAAGPAEAVISPPEGRQ